MRLRRRRPAPAPDQSAELRAELLTWLHDHRTHVRLSTEQRRRAQWVMSAEWLEDLLRLGATLPFDEEQRMSLLGLPVDIRADGGAPHIEIGGQPPLP